MYNPNDIASQLLGNAYELSSYENESHAEPMRLTAAASKFVNAQTKTAQIGAQSVVGVTGASKGGAQFNIDVTRNSTNLAVGLPVILWGFYEYQSSYTQVLTLPSGISCSVAPAPNKTDLRFTYTDGDATDTIDVVCQELPYLNLLTASGRGLIELSKIRVSVPSDSQLIQFNQKLETNRRSMFGKSSSDSIVPQAFKTEMQQQNTIISLPVTYVIDEERFMRVVMAKVTGVSAPTFSLACFARFFDKRA